MAKRQQTRQHRIRESIALLAAGKRLGSKYRPIGRLKGVGTSDTGRRQARQVVILDREIAHSYSGRREDGIGHRGRDRRHTGLAQPSQVRIGPDELDADSGRIG